MNRSFHLFTIPSACIAEMILKLLHQGVDLTPRRSSPALQNETIHHYAEEDAGQKSDHEAIGEYLVGHALYLLLPQCSLKGLKYFKSPQYSRRLAWASRLVPLGAGRRPSVAIVKYGTYFQLHSA